MGGGFDVVVTSGDGYVVLSVSGELDLAEAPALRNSLDRLVRSGTPLIVVDATELTFLDSTGIGVLVGSHNQQESFGRLLVIANLSEAAGRPVRLTEVDTAIPVHWAPPTVSPWSNPDATPTSILTALGFESAATALADTLNINSETIG
jgi:anti-sigma B factor antagonist